MSELSKVFTVLWDSLPENTPHQVGLHTILRSDDKIYVFGNDRNFPVPPGWYLVDACIGLVDTNPKRSRMALPRGRVDVKLPSGALLSIGELVPSDVDSVKVLTPNVTGGVHNWAGIQLVFDRLGIHPGGVGGAEPLESMETIACRACERRFSTESWKRLPRPEFGEMGGTFGTMKDGKEKVLGYIERRVCSCGTPLTARFPSEPQE